MAIPEIPLAKSLYIYNAIYITLILANAPGVVFMAKRRGFAVLRKIPETMPIIQLNAALERLQGLHPEFEVFYDGDLKAIVGIHKEK